jgi:SulP family sulfate permease
VRTTIPRLPILTWARQYRSSDVRGDVAGALTAWAMVVPESVAYAQIAGVPPQHAFYAAPIALIVYAALGSSRNLVVGATSAASIMSASTVAAISSDPHTVVQLSAALAIVAGVILMAAGLLRLGFVTNFLAPPALEGFLFGMALIIVVRQLGKIVGISGGEGDFFRRLWHLLSQIGDWSATTIAVGLIGIAALLLLERVLPRLPASLLVLVAGLVLSHLLSLEHHGVEVVGRIPAAIPSLDVPDVSAHQLAQLVGGGVGIALIVFAESFSIANRFARGEDGDLDANQEMVAIGAANAAAGLVAGFSVSGSASRTAAAVGAGSRTQLLSIIAAVMLLITGAFLTPVFTQLPEPILGAIVVVAVRGFLELAPLKRYWHRDRASFAVLATALVGVLTFDLLPGLIIAVVLSLALFIARASAPQLVSLGLTADGTFHDQAAHAGAGSVAGALVLRPSGALFFGNVDRLRKAVLERIATAEGSRDVVLDLEASFRLSLPVLDSLGALRSQLESVGTQLWLAGLPGSARHDLDADPLADALGPDHSTGSVAEAVALITAARLRT